MSVRINLLPHREERRKRARTHFAVLGGMTAALGIAIVAAVFGVGSRLRNNCCIAAYSAPPARSARCNLAFIANAIWGLSRPEAESYACASCWFV